MNYYWIKVLHLSTVTFNIVFFTLRFFWARSRPSLVKRKAVRRLSQINDSLLLIAGITMAVMIHQYPFVHHWLTAKLLALVVYIIAGYLALHRARGKLQWALYGLIAFISIAYILATALTRSAQSWQLLGL